MRIHIVAVSGTGMGPLAGLLHSMGHEVTGSDVAFDPPIGPRLIEWGVKCQKGFDVEHLASGPELVVIGNLCRSNNPEARFAIDSGLPYTHIGGALQRFVLPGTRPVIIAGTHGKTTTSVLTAGLLEAAGLKPGFLIGGVPQGLDRSFRAPPLATGSAPGSPFPGGPVAGGPVAGGPVAGGPVAGGPVAGGPVPRSPAPRSLLQPRSRPPFVIEGDEYDTAFFEKTAKFLHYSAELVVLTSIEHDHIDIYPSLADYLRPFERLIAELPVSGLVVANAADEHVVRIVRERARSSVIWYALEGQETFGVAPHWLVAPAAADATGSSFDLFLGGVAAGRWVTPLMGRHNLANVAAALALATHGFGVEPSSLRLPLSTLRGAARRQDLLGTPDGVFVYDDFAHHPTAVRETLLGFRGRHPRAKLFAVFEPRSATACRNLHQDVYPEALAVADVVLLAPLARELPADQALDVPRVAREVAERGRAAGYYTSLDEIVRTLTEQSQAGDVIAVLSNGTFGGIHQKLLSALEQRATARAVP